MNERIRQLMEESGLHIAYENKKVTEKELEFFAECIVRECADIASDVGTDTVPSDFALDKCYEIESKIKERFGVR